MDLFVAKETRQTLPLFLLTSKRVSPDENAQPFCTTTDEERRSLAAGLRAYQLDRLPLTRGSPLVVGVTG